ncbi:MAG: hypothetical protein ACRDJE_29225, partial [Dehalococcoidia bacterium]
LRDMLATYGLECNRERLHDEDQPAVKFESYPYPERWIDDFVFGYLVADRKLVKSERQFAFKRDTTLRVNLAVALEPYRHDALLKQSPKAVNSPWQNAPTAQLLHGEIAYTAYQYPFAVNLADWHLDDADLPVEGVHRRDGGLYATRGDQYADWLRYLFRAISELTGVAGNHARSLFFMEPASIVARVTDRLAPGHDLYPFCSDGSLPEVVDGILKGDYPGTEFIVGGNIVKDEKLLPADKQARLVGAGTTLYRTPSQALDAVARRTTGDGFLPEAARPVSPQSEVS